jgi:hypothetical protein
MEFVRSLILGVVIDSEIRVDATTVTLAAIAAILGLLLLKKTYEERTSTGVTRPVADAVDGASAKPPATDAHLIALIAAAATVALGRPVAVRRITFINRDTVSGWAEAGRTSIHLSHNPRRN